MKQYLLILSTIAVLLSLVGCPKQIPEQQPTQTQPAVQTAPATEEPTEMTIPTESSDLEDEERQNMTDLH